LRSIGLRYYIYFLIIYKKSYQKKKPKIHTISSFIANYFSLNSCKSLYFVTRSHNRINNSSTLYRIMKFDLRYGLFIFADNQFSAEKGFKNISQNSVRHCCADTCALDIIANKFFSEFYYS